jgi:hypothetical protein
MADNLFVKLEETLLEFKTFLKDKGPLIINVIKALRALIPEQIDPLIDGLIRLLKDLAVEVGKLKVFPEIDDSLVFAAKVKNLVDASKALLPDSEELKKVSEAVDVIASLPSIEETRENIISLIGEIILALEELKEP